MKLKRILFVCCLFLGYNGKGQEYKFLYYLDTDLGSVAKDKATIIGKGLKENGLFRLDCFSAQNNRLLMTIHFKDSTISVLEGPFKSYHSNGMLEREGNFINDLEEGNWFKWGPEGQRKDSIVYKNGVPWVRASFHYYREGRIMYYELTDSLQDTHQTISYDSSGQVVAEANFKGQKGVVKTYTEKGIVTDSVFTREEREASFPGGDDGWRRYLQKNLNPNVPINNGARAGKYTVIIRFIVRKDGSLDGISAETKNGYGMEEHVIKLIKRVPKWIPAIQYGRYVSAYRRQPVVFVVE